MATTISSIAKETHSNPAERQHAGPDSANTTSTQAAPVISPNDDSEAQQEPFVWAYQSLTPFHEFLFIVLICMSQFLTQAGFGQILIPFKPLAAGLHITSPGQLSWTVASYSLTVGTFVLPAGRLGDMFGSKRMVVIGWTWFGLWSVIAGLSVFVPIDADGRGGLGRVVMFCTCQGLRGIGPAILLPNAVAIAGRSYPPNSQRKNMVFAAFAMCAPTGAWFGALFGSLFGQLAWWPWTLWSLGITAVGMAVAAAFVIPADKKENIPKGQTFDFVGAGLGVSGLILFNFAWNQASVVGWQEPYVPVLLVVGILLLVTFGFWERRVEQPLLPAEIFTIGTGTILLVTSLGWQSFGVFTFYLVQIITELRHNTSIGIVAQLTTLTVAGATAAIATGLSIKYIPPHWMITISSSAFTVGNILLATMPEYQIYWAQTFVGLIVIPFGMDISFPAASLVLSNMVPGHLQGVAASLVNTVINYSISIGLGIVGTAEREVRAKGASVLHAYRVALFIGVGMAGGSLLIAVCFALHTEIRNRRKGGGEKSASESEDVVCPET